MREQVSDVLTQRVAMRGVRFQVIGSMVEVLMFPFNTSETSHAIDSTQEGLRYSGYAGSALPGCYPSTKARNRKTPANNCI